MCVLLITWLLRLVGRFNHTSWVAVVTLTDRPKSVRNRCIIEVFWLLLGLLLWIKGLFSYRTESDLFLFSFNADIVRVHSTPNRFENNPASRLLMLSDISFALIFNYLIARKRILLSDIRQTERIPWSFQRNTRQQNRG